MCFDWIKIEARKYLAQPYIWFTCRTRTVANLSSSMDGLALTSSVQTFLHWQDRPTLHHSPWLHLFSHYHKATNTTNILMQYLIIMIKEDNNNHVCDDQFIGIASDRSIKQQRIKKQEWSELFKWRMMSGWVTPVKSSSGHWSTDTDNAKMDFRMD